MWGKLKMAIEWHTALNNKCMRVNLMWILWRGVVRAWCLNQSGNQILIRRILQKYSKDIGMKRNIKPYWRKRKVSMNSVNSHNYLKYQVTTESVSSLQNDSNHSTKGIGLKTCHMVRGNWICIMLLRGINIQHVIHNLVNWLTKVNSIRRNFNLP